MKTKYFSHLLLVVAAILVISNCSVNAQDLLNQTDKQGLKQGKWEARYPNGQIRYQGQFVDGKETGTFSFFDEEGNLKATNSFSENGSKAYNKMYSKEGILISEGVFIDKKKNGEWRFYDEKTKTLILTEEYQNDTLNGVSRSFFQTGNISEETHYQNGIIEGLWQSFFPNNILEAKANYLNGKFDGESFFYYPNGLVKEQGFFKSGTKVGIWKVYDDEGNLISEDEHRVE